jgi:hypothetical protein
MELHLNTSNNKSGSSFNWKGISDVIKKIKKLLFAIEKSEAKRANPLSFYNYLQTGVPEDRNKKQLKQTI